MIDAHRLYQTLFNKSLDTNELISRDLQKELKTKMAAKDMLTVGEIYILMFSLSTKKIDHVLRAGQSFEKAGDKSKAAMCYFLASKEFAEEGFGIQALAALQMHQRIAPEEKARIQPILEQCQEQGFASENMDPLMMTGMRVSYHLRANNVFSRLSQEAFETVLEATEHRYLDDGEVLTPSTAKSRSIYIVVNGTLEEWASVKGQPKRLNTIPGGGICGSIGYFTGDHRNVLIKAQGKSEVMILPYDKIDQMQENNDELKSHWQMLYQEHVLGHQMGFHPMMKSVHAPQRVMLAKKMEAFELPKGEALFQEGESGEDVYFVRSGRMAVMQKVDGSPKMVRQLRTGAFAGEQTHLNGGVHPATVFAMEDCLLMKIHGEDFRNLLKDFPAVEEVIREKMKEE